MNYKEYVPPLLGNGDISFQADYEGCMLHTAHNVRNNPTMRIWRAGYRFAGGELIPFGYFRQNIGERTLQKHFQQLDTERAVAISDCSYDGAEIHSEIAVHHNHSLIMIKKKISKNIKYTFEYVLDDSSGQLLKSAVLVENGVCIDYRIAGGNSGRIQIFADKEVEARICGDVVLLECDGTDSLTVYILFDGEITKQEVLDRGYKLLFAEHCAAWSQYYAEGFVNTGIDSIDRAYKTAQYHLKCITTRWSIPIGICDELWHGRYFAFDEFYMLMALLTSNHTTLAKRVPQFRADGLEKAVKRGSAKISVKEAHYPWETLENGSEGSPSGYWHDHVFHMACIACGEYYYYKYTCDEKFLKETAYPVIRACAAFYVNHMLYEVSDDRLIVGKCTDLERLGSSVANAFMTTCAVVKTLEILSEAAGIIGVDSEFAEECREKASRLLKSLPNDGEKYIPYEDCTEVSIGLMSGTYPFDVIKADDSMQLNAISSYLESESSVGNMYAVGGGVCSWYGTWKAIVLGRLGNNSDAFEAIKTAADTAGEFGEMYEISDIESGTFYRPWFSTAAGMLIHSVNEMLLKFKDGILYIAPSLPEKITDFSFKLAAENGIIAEVSAEDGVITRLKINREGIKVAAPQRFASTVPGVMYF